MVASSLRRLSRLASLTAALCALVAPLAAGAAPKNVSKRKGAAVLRQKIGAPARAVPSPKRRHVARVVRGALLVDGKRVARGDIVGRPVWRRDGTALAFVRHAAKIPGGLQLVVLPSVDARLHAAKSGLAGPPPLTWRLPRLVGKRPHLFWVGRQSVGLGARALTPRVVVSWTTRIARR